MELSESKKEYVKAKTEGFDEHTGWDNPVASQLEEVLLDNLCLIFLNAIEGVTEWGYNEAVAERAISRRGLFVGSKDPVMAIVTFTLNLLWIGEKIDASMDFKFDNIRQMAEYTLLEMVGVVREVRPFLSVGEAMWWLLICDLDVMQACRLEEDSSGLRCEGCSEKMSSESVLSQWRSEAQNQLSQTVTFLEHLKQIAPTNPYAPEGTTTEDERLASMISKMGKSWGNVREVGKTKSQASASGGSSRAGSRGHSKGETARLMPKPFNFGRTSRARGSKGLLRSGKLGSAGDIVIESKLKYSLGIPGMSLKIGYDKTNTGSGGKATLANEKRTASTDMPSTSLGTGNSSKLHGKAIPSSPPTRETKIMQTCLPGPKPDSKSLVDSTGSHGFPDYYADIPYDKPSGKYLPQDEKDELILKLVPWLQELQSELHGWTEWANQKIMQAARKLSKVQPELKTMRQLTEAAKRFIQENNMKRLSILENGVNGINSLVKKGNSIICTLEEENSRMKKELEVAKSKALQSAANYQLALEKEHKAQNEVLSWDGQIRLLQKELETDKKTLAALQLDLVKAKNNQNKMEARLERERIETEKLLTKAASIKKEREHLEVVAKAEVDGIKHKAKIDTQKSMEDIGKLESRFLEAVSKSDSSRIAALKRGTTESFEKYIMEAECLITMTGNQNFLGHYRNKGLRQERECVMCLSEEMSVVFVPCSHQVLCEKCNELHENQGMKDCPSCRTPIQGRIKVRFANS